MGTAMVTLKGTWSRTNTERWEVTQYRQAMRLALERNGGWFDAVCPRAQPDDGSLEGTFEVCIPVSERTSSYRQKERAAKKIFEAIMALEMCRIPRVRYTKASTRTNWSFLRPYPVIK